MSHGVGVFLLREARDNEQARLRVCRARLLPRLSLTAAFLRYLTAKSTANSSFWRQKRVLLCRHSIGKGYSNVYIWVEEERGGEVSI